MFGSLNQGWMVVVVAVVMVLAGELGFRRGVALRTSQTPETRGAASAVSAADLRPSSASSSPSR